MRHSIMHAAEVLLQPFLVLIGVDRVATKVMAAVHEAKEVERGLAAVATLSGKLVRSDVDALATSTQSKGDPATMLATMSSLWELHHAER